MLFVGSGLSGGTNDAISVGLALVKSIARSPFACPATKAVDPRAIAIALGGGDHTRALRTGGASVIAATSRAIAAIVGECGA